MPGPKRLSYTGFIMSTKKKSAAGATGARRKGVGGATKATGPPSAVKATPKKAAPKKAAPKKAAPKKAAPKKAAPKKAAPKKAAPKKAAPKKAAPKKAAPKKAAPKKAAPKKAAPKKAAPKKAAPKKTAPKKTAPRKTAPKKTAPRKAAPKKTAPKKTAPKKTAPKKTAPKKTAPKKTAPKKTAPKKAAPKKAAPKKAAPRKAAPKKAAPKKAAPKKAAPKKAAPKKAAPRRRRRSSAAALVPPGAIPGLSEEDQIRSAKYLPREQPKRVFEEDRFLFPESYGVNRVRLLVRDPEWIFAYWDVSAETMKGLARSLGERTLALSRLTLRVLDPVSGGSSDILLPAGARWWYIRADSARRTYRSEIGITLPSGEFRQLAESNAVVTPRVGPSRQRAERRLSYRGAREVPPREAAAAGTAERKAGLATEPWTVESIDAASNVASEGERGGASESFRPARPNDAKPGASDAFRPGASDTHRR